MSDARLRELERRWRETGSADDEVALLRAARRSGAVDDERLLAAAALGDAASLLALEREVVQRGEAPAREMAALARLLELPSLQKAWDELPLLGDPERLNGGSAPWRAALAAVEAWALCPCVAHAPVVPALSRARARVKDERARALGELERRITRVVERLEEVPTRPLLRGAAVAERGRVRAWQLRRPLADVVEGRGVLTRERVEASLRLAAQAFSGALSAFRLEPPTVRSRSGGDPVAPITTSGPAILARATCVPAKRVRRVHPAELLHDLLPRWAAEGIRVALIYPWAELDALEVQRAIIGALPADVAAEHRAHLEWVKRKATTAAKATPGTRARTRPRSR